MTCARSRLDCFTSANINIIIWLFPGANAEKKLWCIPALLFLRVYFAFRFWCVIFCVRYHGFSISVALKDCAEALLLRRGGRFVSICCSTGGAQDFFFFSIDNSESAMATRVDTWSPAPQADGECTVTAFVLADVQVGAESSRAAPGPAGVLCQVHCPLHGMGCSASHAHHVLALNSDGARNSLSGPPLPPHTPKLGSNVTKTKTKQTQQTKQLRDSLLFLRLTFTRF